MSLKNPESITKKKYKFCRYSKTVDNDVKHNELSIGYDTAVDVAKCIRYASTNSC